MLKMVLKYKNSLLSSVLYNQKLNIFGFRTVGWMRIWDVVVGIFQSFLTFYRLVN